jgi:DNA polymerase
MLQVSRPRAQRKRKAATVPTWDEDPDKLQLVYARCRLDVVTTRAVFSSPKLERLSDTERRYQLQDAAINARGVRLDRQFVSAAMELAFRERTAINLKLQELTLGAITSIDQSARFLAAVNSHGHAMTTVNKRAVAQVLAHRPDDYVRRLLELRQIGARAAVNKFRRMLAFASPHDDRLRGMLRMYGTATGRWTGLGPQLQNLKRNEVGLPLSVVDSVRSGDREGIARYGAPLALLGDISRAALCAAPGTELMSGDFSAIESVVLAWLAGETWKLAAYRTYQESGDTTLEPYRIIARRMLHKEADAEITDLERQLGKRAELAAGFGGSVGAWRRIAPHDPRTDDEIKAIIQQWRAAHPLTRRFWTDLSRSLRIAIRTEQPILVAPAPQPPIVASSEDGTLRIRLPSGRAIAYPQARLVPGKFEEAPPDIEFHDNARAQWKPYRGWFGVFVENVVSGIARDLLAAAIARFEERGLAVVFHCHDEITIETPIGALSEQTFRDLLLDSPAWAAGLPLAGKVHSGQHYLPPPESPAEPLPQRDPDERVLEAAIEAFIDDTRDDIGPIDDPVLVEREDDQDFIANLPDEFAPLTELVSLPLTPDNKVCCPFHEEIEPSCAIYPDHFHCFGCGEHGSRLDWLQRAEGMTKAEALVVIKDWTGPCRRIPRETDAAEKLAYAMAIWTAAGPLIGSLAERYLDETRAVDLTKLPPDLHRSLRFHPVCVFGSGVFASCLIALMRDPVTDAPVGIQRIALEERDGRVEKIERKMLGQAGIVKLWPAGRTLVVGEGLETVLAAATRIPFEGVSLIPAWAAMSKGGLAQLPVIDGVERLLLLADNDSNGAGQAAAEACKRRWQAAGRAVVILMPDAPDSDFNDLVIEEDARASHA